MKKSIKLNNLFLILRLGKNGKFNASSYRKLRRDMLNVASKLEETINGDLKYWQFDAHRKRVSIMFETIKQIDNGMQKLFKAGSEHNCFWVRMRTEKLINFLNKYCSLLNKYNNEYLEKIHEQIKFAHVNGLIVKDNLILEEDNIEIRG